MKNVNGLHPGELFHLRTTAMKMYGANGFEGHDFNNKLGEKDQF